jgi:DNA-binding Xre family transcriptional regulator
MEQKRDTELLQKVVLVLKALRGRTSQQTVYNETNIHIGRIEAEAENITISTLSYLCKYFGLSLSEFFRRVEEL